MPAHPARTGRTGFLVDCLARSHLRRGVHMKCPGCQAECTTAQKFCAACGLSLPTHCPACAFANEAASDFCRGCGRPLKQAGTAPAETFAPPRAYTPAYLAQKILTSQSALQGERKPVTVLFCDIANSTMLAAKVGPEVMHQLLNGFFELAMAEIHRYEGTINQFLGDGFMALFGAPLAHEDHARRAVLAAAGIQRALRERAGAFAHGSAAALAARIGLNTGSVVVGTIGDNLRMDYTAVGDATHLAARLQQLAEPGAVFMSESTQRSVQRHFDTQRIGERTLKGIAHPVPVYRLTSPRAAGAAQREDNAVRVSSPLVGREAERASLAASVGRALAGLGSIVCITADAGLGKSRLVAEVRGEAASAGARWLEGRALSFSQSMSYLPFLQIIRSWAGINEDDAENAAWAKLERQVGGLFGHDAVEVLPHLATLLSIGVQGAHQSRVKHLEAQAVGRQIFITARRFFERLARERPLVLVFEDWHWADASSAQLLEHLLPLTKTSALLLCCAARPDAGSAAARLHNIAQERYPECHSTIRLAPLDGAQSARLVDNLLACDDATARLSELVRRKAEGNPLYLEEVVRSLIAMHALALDEATGRWRADAEPGEITISDTIQGVILARIDRLDEPVKQTLKLAAVVGRSFLLRVLAATAAAEAGAADKPGLERQLADLLRADLIRERRRLPELEYTFKHALVQEAAYSSILAERKRLLHQRVAGCIESLYPERLDENASLLAYHFVRAENWQKAQQYLFKAGDQAAKVAADAEALAHYEQAASAYARVFGERWDRLQRAAFERKMGEALFRRGEHQQASDYLLRALACLGVHYPRQRWRIRVALLEQLARQVARRLLQRSQPGRTALPTDAAMDERVRVFVDLSWILYFVDPELLLLNTLTCLNTSERAGAADGVCAGAMPVGLLCDMAGLAQVASSYHRRAVFAAEASGLPASLGMAYLGQGLHEQYAANMAKSLEMFDRSGKAYGQAGDLRGWGGTLLSISQMKSDRGDLAGASANAHEMIRIGSDGADHQVHAWGLLCRGLAGGRAGAADAAAADLRDAIALLRSVPDFPMLAWASCCLGELHLRWQRLDEGVKLIEEGSRIIAEHHVLALQVAICANALALARLAVAERSDADADRAMAMKRAQRACRVALAQSKTYRPGWPIATRLRGRYEWLCGRRGAAHTWWSQSVLAAEQSGAAYELGLTLLEIGTRAGQRPALERAEVLFADIGAQHDLAAARAAIRALTDAWGQSPK